MTEKLALIRQKCIEANPNAIPQEDYHCGGCGECEACLHYDRYKRPIRLADVLLAIKEKYMKGTLQKSGEVRNGTEWFGEIAWDWNLRKDNLEDQSEETINFLWELLK